MTATDLQRSPTSASLLLSSDPQHQNTLDASRLNSPDVAAQHLGGPPDLLQSPSQQMFPTPSPYDLTDRTSRRAYLRQVRKGPSFSQVQIDRALTIIQYHRATSHKSFVKIRNELLRGSIAGLTHLSATDVDNAVAMFGPCAHCLAGKMRSPSQTPLQVPSNLTPGQAWEVDFLFTYHNNSPTKRPILICVCVLTGYLVAIPLPSRGSVDVERAGQILHRVLTAHFPTALQTQDLRIHADHESVFGTLAAQIPGCKLCPRPIGDHANRVERYIGIIEERVDAQVHETLRCPYGLASFRVLIF